jgi:hypothetical protein
MVHCGRGSVKIFFLKWDTMNAFGGGVIQVGVNDFWGLGEGASKLLVYRAFWCTLGRYNLLRLMRMLCIGWDYECAVNSTTTPSTKLGQGHA